jgi:hypothetical protein
MNIDFEVYCDNYLVEWEKRATVRTKPRTRLTESIKTENMFVFPLKPFAGHALFEAVDKQKIQEFSVRAACNMFLGVSSFEVDFVTAQCSKLAGAGIGIELPDSAKRVAVAIGTDEMYHAFVANECLADIKRFTGIVPVVQAAGGAADFNARKPPLEHFKQALGPGNEALAEVTLLCFLENNFTEELYGIAKGQTAESQMHTIIREHVMDEGRHMVFFQRLLGHIWESLNDELRCTLGKSMVDFCDIYLTLDEQTVMGGYTSTLRQLGLSDEDCNAIARDTILKDGLLSKSEMPSIVNPKHLMKMAGVLEHQPTRDLMIESGWITDEALVAA